MRPVASVSHLKRPGCWTEKVATQNEVFGRRRHGQLVDLRQQPSTENAPELPPHQMAQFRRGDERGVNEVVEVLEFVLGDVYRCRARLDPAADTGHVTAGLDEDGGDVPRVRHERVLNGRTLLLAILRVFVRLARAEAGVDEDDAGEVDVAVGVEQMPDNANAVHGDGYEQWRRAGDDVAVVGERRRLCVDVGAVRQQLLHDDGRACAHGHVQCRPAIGRGEVHVTPVLDKHLHDFCVAT